MGKNKLQVENIGPVIDFFQELLSNGLVDKNGIKILAPSKKLDFSVRMDGPNILVMVNGINLKIDMFVEVDTQLISLYVNDKEIVPSLHLIPKFLTPKIEVVS